MSIRKAIVLLFLCLVMPLSSRAGTVHRHMRPVDTRYMVTLNRDIPAAAYDGVLRSLAGSYNFTVITEWRDEPRGFICTGLSSPDAQRLANDPRTRIVEQDFEMSVVPTSGTQWTNWNSNYLWHLDRLDEPTYGTHDSTYNMCPEAREVNAYIIDVGVYANHEQFTYNNEPPGRVESYAFDDGSTTGYTDNNNLCNYPNASSPIHGTAVATVVGGTTIGASKVHIISLRIVNCGGSNFFAGTVVNAVRWIRSANDTHRNQPGVVNMSAGWSPDWVSDFATLNDEVKSLVTTKNIPFFTSANNFSGDACKFAPAALAYTNANRYTINQGSVFSVGGTSLGADGDQNDYRWQKWVGGLAQLGQDSGSNGGDCVSIYAPAADIYVGTSNGQANYQLLSGTSFSSPLAAAIGARYLSTNPTATYQQVYDYLLNAAGSSSLINNHYTPEYWACQYVFAPFNYVTYRTNPTVCDVHYTGGDGRSDGTSTPIHFAATSNTSNAGMLYSPMGCP